MNSDIVTWDSAQSLYNWSKNEKYCGWDIYDALNSNRTKKLCMNSSLLQILLSQFNKYSPVNFRYILKIEKGIDAKGMGLFAQSFSKMYNLSKDEKYKDDILECMSFFKNTSLKSSYGYDCWAHYFNYTTLDKSKLSSKIPDVITTSNVIKALVDSYLILENRELKEMAKSAYDFLLNDLLRKTNDGLSYLMYSPVDENKIVINASVLGLDAISKLIRLFENDQEMKDVAYKLCEFLLKTQKPDGSWVYSIYQNGKERVQTDFHQGFNIGGLMEYLPIADPTQKEDVLKCIKKGAKYYRKTQFLEDGRCHFRYPQFYPTDTHAQAQGIIIFSKLSILDSEYLDFAKKIADWTILNMQDDSGYFYTYKHRFFTNKIPHMRWCQAWMLLALSTYLEKIGDDV